MPVCKQTETRAERIARFVTRCAAGEPIHPARRRR